MSEEDLASDEREAQIAITEIKEVFHILYCSPHTGTEEEWVCEVMVKEVVERIQR